MCKRDQLQKCSSRPYKHYTNTQPAKGKFKKRKKEHKKRVDKLKKQGKILKPKMGVCWGI